MITLSLCMIVKNEEDTLGRCLESVKPAVEEIIVVDTGSTDKTAAIAKKFGAKVYDFTWIHDFSAARNFAFSKATCDYIMWLDADDVLKPNDLDGLIAVKSKLDGKISQVVARYDVGFDENGEVNFSYNRERIFLRKAGFKWQGAVHETISVAQDAICGDFAITHAKVHPTERGRNLKIYEALLRSGEVFGARELYYYGRELYYNDRTEDAACAFEQLLKTDAWREDKIGACLLLARCHKAAGRANEALSALYRSFLLSQPRAEICCEIAGLYFDRADYQTAAYWYQTALRDVADYKSGAFIRKDFYGFIPMIQLCVCYDRMGKYDVAQAFNEQAALYKPNDPAIDLNRKYFEKRRATQS